MRNFNSHLFTMSNRKAPGGLPQLSQPPALDEVLKWFKEDWPTHRTIRTPTTADFS